jgi:hypothetical protein
VDRRGEIAELLSIHVRPPEIEERQFPGHWEGDLIKGLGNASAVGTLVERSSRLLLLVKLPHPNPATAAHVLQAFTDKLNAIAQPMRQSLTYDRGKEMARHQELAANTGIAVYFCDPYSPWQRGTNENTNGLVRQYLPKGTDLSGYSQDQLDAIADDQRHPSFYQICLAQQMPPHISRIQQAAWRTSFMALCGLSRLAPELGPTPRLLLEPLSGRSHGSLEGLPAESRLGLTSFIKIPLRFDQ